MHRTTYIPSRIQKRQSQFDQLGKVALTAIAIFLLTTLALGFLAKAPEAIYFYKNCF